MGIHVIADVDKGLRLQLAAQIGMDTGYTPRINHLGAGRCRFDIDSKTDDVRLSVEQALRTAGFRFHFVRSERE